MQAFFLCEILIKCNILCLQELIISKQDCHMLNTCRRDYLGYEVYPVEKGEGMEGKGRGGEGSGGEG